LQNIKEFVQEAFLVTFKKQKVLFTVEERRADPQQISSANDDGLKQEQTLRERTGIVEEKGNPEKETDANAPGAAATTLVLDVDLDDNINTSLRGGPRCRLPEDYFSFMDGADGSAGGLWYFLPTVDILHFILLLWLLHYGYAHFILLLRHLLQ
jgi:hypothetical protein